MLERLSDDLLVHVLSWLDGGYGGKEELLLESTLSALPRVCRSWNQAMGRDKTGFWNLMVANKGRRRHPFEYHDGENNNNGSRRRATRSNSGRTNHPKNFFFRHRRDLRDRYHRDADARLLGLARRLEASDCVAFVRKQRLAPRLVNHGVSDLEQRTLLHYASWYGRTKTVQFLLGEGASVRELDDSNASPLLVAAWAGQASVVKLLLAKLAASEGGGSGTNLRAFLDIRGVPPLTSSCGGKGPKTALVWAQRKGFHRVVRLLEEGAAAPSRSFS